MSITFQTTTNPESTLFDDARRLTGSDGFSHDAIAFAAFDGDNKDPALVAVLQNFTTDGAEVHLGADRPTIFRRRDVQLGFYLWAFDYLKVECLLAIIPVENDDAMIFSIKSGFRPAGYTNAGPICAFDAMLLTMTRDQCRWIPTHAPAVTVEPLPETADAAEED